MMTPDQPHFCTYCAAPLKAGAPFCAECGRAVPAHVDHSVPLTPAAQPCRFCGAPTEPEDRFCPVCGHDQSRWVGAAAGAAEESSGSGEDLLRRIVVIAVIVALVSGGGLGLLANNLFGSPSAPLSSASPGILVVISPPPTLAIATQEPVPSASPATPSEAPSPIASESPFASPSAGLASESPGLGSPSVAPESASPSFESPSPSLGARTIVVGQTRTDPPAKGNFRVTLKQIDVLADGTMQFSFHVKNVRHQNDCVKLSSDGLDDFLVDSAGTRYVPTGWATVAGPLPFDQCGPILHPGDVWDYFDIFPGLDDPSRTFDLTIYHGDLAFTGLSVTP
jgi:hypothetical protein